MCSLRLSQVGSLLSYCTLSSFTSDTRLAGHKSIAHFLTGAISVFMMAVNIVINVTNCQLTGLDCLMIYALASE